MNSASYRYIPARAAMCGLCNRHLRLGVFAAVLIVLRLPIAEASELPDTVAGLKPSVVGVGTMSYARRPAGNLLGTGFVVADGRHVATNAHVLPAQLGEEEFVAVFVARGSKVRAMRSSVVARDRRHDLAVIRFDGQPMDALILAADDSVREGEPLAFTGYPIETLHGIHAATHLGIVSSIVEVGQGRPTLNEDADSTGGFTLFQLDATAFPGNSGSPLYRPADGVVVGVVSKVSARDPGEGGVADYRGITYAVPARHLRELLREAGFTD